MSVPQSVSTHLNALDLSPSTVHYNLPPARLYEAALDRDEAVLAADGPLVVRTAPHTGRSPDDRFLVRDTEVADTINWGEVNRPTDRETFNHLHRRMAEYADGRPLFVKDLYAGWDEDYRLPVRVVTEKAWHSLFAHNMFVRPEGAVASDFEPGFTVVDLCKFEADPERDGTNSEAAIFIDLKQRLVLIGGTHYAGEIKKSIFSALNYMLPEEGVLPMHCSANKGPDGDAAVFFGLSGTGKTTLSTDDRRALIGDDEHAWSRSGVYNFEGGCYAKMIDITPESEPEIYGTTKEFGTILENVVLNPETREPDFADATVTRNTRGSYPLDTLPNVADKGQGPHPSHILFLTYDAFGVLPPLSELTPEQAMYHFLSGYTAKVAGTERGVTTPKATFSTCFGEPFMVRHPTVYAELLAEKMKRHDADCWLVNTGLTGGPYGTGHRIELEHTRSMVDAVLNDALANTPRTEHEIFGLSIPQSVPHVPSTLLHPRRTWDDPAAYDEQARALAQLFDEHFETFVDHVPPAVAEAGPRTASVPQ
ncbi:MAG: phosphoenolpyruvate carboxykinase (ATP) [Salinivenus sp.]